MNNILRNITLTVYLISFYLLTAPAMAAEKVLLYAAASTSHAVTEIIKQFNQITPEIKVKVSFASSSTLAKQIEAGAPAQLFISANPKWMDYLQQRQLIINQSRRNLLSNEIVLITPKGKAMTVTMNETFDFAEQLTGRLCLGDPAHVPAGIYAKQALISMGWWPGIKAHIVGTKDVRAALAFVELGECAAGIVYATDASASNKIDLVAVFPAASHSPIVYPVAALTSNKAAITFLQYLNSPAASTVFKQHGFSTPK